MSEANSEHEQENEMPSEVLREITPYGFKFGPAIVERVREDPKLGVWIMVQTKSGAYADIHVSAKGRNVHVTQGRGRIYNDQ